MLRSALIGLGLAVLSSSAALAEWQYCYAGAGTEHKFFISEPFDKPRDMNEADAQFQKLLDQHNITHGGVGCPRADSEAQIRDRIRQAVTFNAQDGNKAITLKWAPTRNGWFGAELTTAR